MPPKKNTSTKPHQNLAKNKKIKFSATMPQHDESFEDQEQKSKQKSNGQQFDEQRNQDESSEMQVSQNDQEQSNSQNENSNEKKNSKKELSNQLQKSFEEQNSGQDQSQAQQKAKSEEQQSQSSQQSEKSDKQQQKKVQPSQNNKVIALQGQQLTPSLPAGASSSRQQDSVTPGFARPSNPQENPQQILHPQQIRQQQRIPQQQVQTDDFDSKEELIQEEVGIIQDHIAGFKKHQRSNNQNPVANKEDKIQLEQQQKKSQQQNQHEQIEEEQNNNTSQNAQETNKEDSQNGQKNKKKKKKSKKSKKNKSKSINNDDQDKPKSEEIQKQNQLLQLQIDKIQLEEKQQDEDNQSSGGLVYQNNVNQQEQSGNKFYEYIHPYLMLVGSAVIQSYMDKRPIYKPSQGSQWASQMSAQVLLKAYFNDIQQTDEIQNQTDKQRRLSLLQSLIVRQKFYRKIQQQLTQLDLQQQPQSNGSQLTSQKLKLSKLFSMVKQFKIIASCLILQKKQNSQTALNISTSCYWQKQKDGQINFSYEGKNTLVMLTLYGVETRKKQSRN